MRSRIKLAALLLTTALALTACGSSAASGGADAQSDVKAKVCKPSDCTLQQVCTLSGACLPLFPRIYSVTLQSAEFASFNSTGNGWDCKSTADTTPACLPDGYAQLLVDGAVKCQTDVIADTKTPAWNKTCAVEITAKSAVELRVFDSDAPNPDEDTEVPPIADLASDLRNGVGKYQSSSVTLNVTWQGLP